MDEAWQRAVYVNCVNMEIANLISHEGASMRVFRISLNTSTCSSEASESTGEARGLISYHDVSLYADSLAGRVSKPETPRYFGLQDWTAYLIYDDKNMEKGRMNHRARRVDCRIHCPRGKPIEL